MKHSTEIQILGTPSTKFTYINHILKQVIERAGISVDYKEITDVKALLKLNIEAIPMVRINGKAFDFSNGTPTNEKLKDLILYILDNEEFGSWPLISLITKDRIPNSAYLLSRKLSSSWNSVIDWYSFDKKCGDNSENIPKERLDSLIRSSMKDWRGQLFSSPLTRYFNTGNALPSFEDDNSLINSSLIILGDLIEDSMPFIKKSVFDLGIPVILLTRENPSISSYSVFLLKDEQQTYPPHPLLQQLSEKVATNESYNSCEQKDLCYQDQLDNWLADGTDNDMDRAIAIQFSSRDQLDHLLNNPILAEGQIPIIILPNSSSNNSAIYSSESKIQPGNKH